MMNRPQEKSPLMTAKEAAVYLRLSVNTLNRYRIVGGGPVYQRIGTKDLFYYREDRDAWRQA